MRDTYFDNAATTLKKPETVGKVVYDALTLGQYGNPARGTHEFSLNSFRAVEQVRGKVKALLNAPDETYEVVFTNNATMSLNIGIKGHIRSKSNVLTTTWEHNAVLRPLYQLEEQLGIGIFFVPSSPQTGELDYQELENQLKQQTIDTVILNHGSNVTGNVIDLEKIKPLKEQYDFTLILDASQTMGQYPIDLSDSVVDILCFTGHKSLYGPTGTGGICLKKSLKMAPLITGGDGMKSFSKTQPEEYPTLLEAGTLNVAGIIGLGAGIDAVLEKGVADTLNHVQRLRQKMWQGLEKNPQIILYGLSGSDCTGVLSFNIKDTESALVSDYLWTEHNIATRPGYHCAPEMHRSLGTQAHGTVRCAFSRYNTVEEVENFLTIINELSENV